MSMQNSGGSAPVQTSSTVYYLNQQQTQFSSSRFPNEDMDQSPQQQKTISHQQQQQIYHYRLENSQLSHQEDHRQSPHQQNLILQQHRSQSPYTSMSHHKMAQRVTHSPQLHSVSSSNSSISPAPDQTFQQQPAKNPDSNQPSEQDILKCALFFKSLLKMRPQQTYNILDLKNLLREVLLGEQTPEEFTVKLREVTKSQDKGNLLPFLRRALPALRRSIQNGEHLDLRQSLDLDESSPTSQLPTPPSEIHQPTAFADQQRPQKTEFPSSENHYPHTQFVVSANPNTIQLAQAQETQQSPNPPTAEKMMLANPEEMDTTNAVPIADNLNNLPQMLLNPQALADRILTHMPEAEGVDPDVLAAISNAAEARLRTILAHLCVLAEHRMEPLRINPMYRVVDEPRKQLRFMEDIDKRAHESRQTAEKEALLKITKSKGKDKDTLEKAKQMQKADREAMVNREANAAAFAALGTRSGTKRPFAATVGGGADWKAGMQNQGLSAGLTGMTGRASRVKRVTMRDLQFFLSVDPSIPSNSKLRHRIALASLSSIDENAAI